MFAKLKKKHEQTLASLESRIELKKQSLKELEAQAQTALYHIADLNINLIVKLFLQKDLTND